MNQYQAFHHSFHSAICLTTGPTPLPKWFLHIVRSRVSSFKWEYPLLSLRSSSSFLRLLPRLLVTSISQFIFPSITCFRRQFLRKMWKLPFFLGDSAKFHLADGSVANGTKPGLMWLSQFQHSITPFVQGRRRNFRLPFTNDWTSVTISISAMTAESYKLAVCTPRWCVSLKS
jgi:hypothetical protein